MENDAFISFAVMARTRRKYARRAKKTVRRTRRTRRVTSRRARGSGWSRPSPSGMPKGRLVHMRAVMPLNVSQIGLTLNYVDVRANCAGDVNGAGKQPMGFDQMAALYTNWMVVGSKCTVTLQRPYMLSSPGDVKSTDALLAVKVGLMLSDSTAHPYTSFQSLLEAKRGSITTLFGSAVGARTVRSNFSAKKFFGVKDIADNWDDLGSTGVSLPQRLAHYVVYYETVDATTTTGLLTQVDGSITVDMAVLWSNPKDLAAS